MSPNRPTILALDFDGVICDGLVEYFQTTKRTYTQIWAEESPSDDLAPRFYQLRPIIETGWEMPILLRALVLGVSDDEILADWSKVVQRIVSEEGLDAQDVGSKLDRVRDRSIETDLDEWLALHRFYPGVLAQIRHILDSSVELYIITTKEGRFVKKLLQQQKIDLPQSSIIGKESQRPKDQTLRQLIEAAGDRSRTSHGDDLQWGELAESERTRSNRNSFRLGRALNSPPRSPEVVPPPCPPVSLWFVEDRLKTLKRVQQQSMPGVRLYLADWGYNTPQMRDSIKNDPDIHLLSLEQFTQDFSAWH